MRLPYTAPPRPRNFPATRLIQCACSRFPTWWGGDNPGEVVYKADGGAAPVAQEDIQSTKTQQSRSKALSRTTYRITLQPLHAKFLPPHSRQVPPQTLFTPVAAATTAFSPQPHLHVSRISLASVHGAIPHFLSDLQPQRCRGGWAEDALTGRGEADSEVTSAAQSGGVSASTDSELLPVVSAGTPGALLDSPPFCDETSQRGDGKCDLLQLQSRYDALLHNPQAFSMQLQLLHACIQNAQQQLAKSVYMKELLPLQQRLRTPGTDACLQVHPLLYAAFCMYNPSHIRIAAAKRVGAAEHFLGEYLKARGSRGYRRRPVSEISRRGRAAADEWLAHTSLSNICIYPLEALSPQLRLFSLAAPQRLAAWEAILSRALAV